MIRTIIDSSGERPANNASYRPSGAPEAFTFTNLKTIFSTLSQSENAHRIDHRPERYRFQQGVPAARSVQFCLQAQPSDRVPKVGVGAVS